jgi:glycosyltransferase involved in cell wall biosynthesis
MNKKILIIINNLGVGGAERLVVGDINEMIRIGIEVTLITLKSEPQRSFVTELQLKQNKFHCIPFEHLFDVPAWFGIVRSIVEFKPNLVITHLWFANAIGRIAARVAGIKSVISFEQNIYDTVKTNKMFFIDWCLQFFSTKIIAVSEAVKKSLLRHHIQEKKIDVLYNSIDLSKFAVLNNNSDIKKEYNLPEETFLYIFVGRLIYQKAVDILIEAFKKTGTDSHLIIVGQGKDLDVLKHQAEKNNLEERVIFAGVRSDIPQLLLSADCFILPSRYEGLPLVLIEALASGISIIVSDFEAAKEVIVHEKNGLIVSKENIEALAQAMRRIKNDNTLRSYLSLEAKKTAERFSISKHVSAILQYIKSKKL